MLSPHVLSSRLGYQISDAAKKPIPLVARFLLASKKRFLNLNKKNQEATGEKLDSDGSSWENAKVRAHASQ